MTAKLQDARPEFDWQCQPAAAQVVADLLRPCIQSNPHIGTLAKRMRDETGTRFVDWLDSLAVADVPELRTSLAEVGYAEDPRESNVWRHDDGLFPAVQLLDKSAVNGAPAGQPVRLTIKVSSVDDFAAAMSEFGAASIEGPAGGQYRIARFPTSRGTELAAAERHGWPGFTAPTNRAQQIAATVKHAAAFDRRRRDGQPNEELFAHARTLFDAAAADLGRDWACDLFFAAERRYWMSRNAAGRIQYARQQALGLGWGNHDHHTYRNSRESFHLLIAFMEHIGFQCRERFYAGREAGWGAQVIEQPATGITIFADVDLSPEEVAGDFAHRPLEPQAELGTVGLWCKLHGEAFLAAGMHHLECQFDFDAVREQLEAAGVPSMAPFTFFPHLKQAFTKGEMFPVSPARLDAALAGGWITAAQAEQFRSEGALGSHLEILERNDGFKGFNQTGISEIILRTDPRQAASRASSADGGF